MRRRRALGAALKPRDLAFKEGEHRLQFQGPAAQLLALRSEGLAHARVPAARTPLPNEHLDFLEREAQGLSRTNGLVQAQVGFVELQILDYASSCIVITLAMNLRAPLLLLPGLMNDTRIWDPLVTAIDAERDVHVAPTHVRDSIAESARDAIASMPSGSFAVAGFSLGGYVAQEVCRQAHDRIAGLALVDTGARADTEEARQVRQRMIHAVESGAGEGIATFNQIAQGFAARIVHASRLQDRELLQLLFDMAVHVGSEGFVRQQRAAMSRADTRDLLPRIHVPAVVVCGREDQVTPLGLSQEMASLLPDAELVEVEEAGHMSILERPATVVAAMLRWLRRVDAGGCFFASSR